MKPSSLIGHTVELFVAVRDDYRRPADAVIDSFFRARKYLGSHDRRFIAETVYGMLRHLRRIQTLLGHCVQLHGTEPRTADFQPLLLYLSYAVGIEEKQPKDVVQTIEPLWNSTHSHLNPMTLAYHLHEHRHLDFLPEGNISRLGVEYSFPDWMIQRWVGQLGETETEALCKAMNVPAALTLRVNTLKVSVEECQQVLQKEGLETQRTSLSPFGLSTSKRTNVFATQAFKLGLFEVQDEGSQLIPLLLDPKPTWRVVDACAGAGGKSLQLAALMQNRGEVFALDVNDYRLSDLRKRARRAEVHNIRVRVVKENNPGELADLHGRADAVLIDAPCSGLGVLRRNPDVKWKTTEDVIKEISAEQRHILQYYAQLLKPGGRLVYATCTTLREENEEIVEEFLSSHPMFSLSDPASILERRGLKHLASEKYLRLYPHRHGTDGFFAAMMVRE